MAGKVTKPVWFPRNPEGFEFGSLLKYFDNYFNHVINMTLCVDTPRNCQSNEFERRWFVATEHD